MCIHTYVYIYIYIFIYIYTCVCVYRYHIYVEREPIAGTWCRYVHYHLLYTVTGAGSAAIHVKCKELGMTVFNRDVRHKEKQKTERQTSKQNKLQMPYILTCAL